MASHAAQAPRYLKTMPTRTYSPKRAVWKRVAFSSSLATLVAIMALFGVNYFWARHAALDAGRAAGNLQREKDPAIESLGRKIATENEEHLVLQSKRAELESSIQQAPAFILTPEERVRRELAKQLAHLLALEREYPEDSFEVTDARERIDDLQSQIEDMSPAERRTYAAASSARTSRETQLADTNLRISQNEVQTKADVSRLGELVRAAELPASRDYSPGRYPAPTVVLISLCLGFITGMTVLILARLFSVRNEVSLRRLLPPRVEVLGTIPQMRARI